jgi:hypothetical protein
MCKDDETSNDLRPEIIARVTLDPETIAALEQSEAFSPG